MSAVFAATQSPACPVGASGPSSYDEAITTTCSALQQKTGDIQYGQCFDYLVWEVDGDSSGHNLSKCFYDVSSHALVGVIFGDGSQDQCSGTSFTVQAGQVDPTCTVSGFNGAGGAFQSCSATPDAGGGG
jgi:hypothetical protein